MVLGRDPCYAVADPLGLVLALAAAAHVGGGGIEGWEGG